MVSLVGYTLAYNTLDNNKSPTSGLYAELTQDLRRRRRRREFHPHDGRSAQLLRSLPGRGRRAQAAGRQIAGWGGKDLRMLDHFQMGPNLVRGFAPAGIGPRDLTSGTTNDALGGTCSGAPASRRRRRCISCRRRSASSSPPSPMPARCGATRVRLTWNVTGETLQVADCAAIRSSVGVGFIWDSPLGPLRFDLAFALTKESYDRTQVFRFSGGTKF